MKSIGLNELMMKTTIKKPTNLALLLFVVLITSTTYAQQRGPQGGGQQGPPPIPTTKQIKAMVSDMSKEVLLSEDQEAEILELYTAHFKEVKEKTKSGRTNRKEMESLRTDFEKEVKSLLTEEQQKLYVAYQKKNRSKGHRRDPRRR